MIYLSGWGSVTSAVHPMHLNNNQLQNDFIIFLEYLLIVDLVNNVARLSYKVLLQFLIICLGRQTRLRM